MKRISVLIALILTLALLFTGCGGNAAPAAPAPKK